MGRKTFESLGRVLPNRKHIVLTRNKDFKVCDNMVQIVSDIKELDRYIKSEEEVFVIGGASIYKMLMPYAKKMYVTKINEEFDADTFFPEIDENEWKIYEKTLGITDEKNPYKYEYITYVRKRNSSLLKR